MSSVSKAFQAGVVAHQQGDLAGAEQRYREVLQRSPRHAGALMHIGLMHQAKGEVDKARDYLEKAARFEPDNPSVLNGLGQVLLAAGAPDEAAAVCQKATDLDPSFAGAWNNLGLAQNAVGDHDNGVVSLSKAVALAQSDAQMRFNLGRAMAESGALDQAVDHLGRAARMAPSVPQIRIALGDVEIMRGAVDSAVRHYLEADRLASGHAVVQHRLGNAYRLLGRFDDAIACLHDAQERASAGGAMALERGYVHLQAGDPDAALEAFRTAARKANGHAASIAQAAIGLDQAGARDIATDLLAPLRDSDRDDPDVALAAATLALKGDDTAAERAWLAEMLAQPDLSPATERGLLFALARLEDRAGTIDAAFGHLTDANRLKRVDHDAEALETLTDRLITTFPAARMSDLARATPSAPCPVFVVGMQESGVDEVADLLSLIDGVGSIGERPLLNQSLANLAGTPFGYLDKMDAIDSAALNSCASAHLGQLAELCPDASHVVERIPANFQHLGIISLLFPHAKIIHCTRDPADTCLACYFADYAGVTTYAYDLDNLAGFWLAYDRLMTHWSSVSTADTTNLLYDALLAEPEIVRDQLVDFLGLTRDPVRPRIDPDRFAVFKGDLQSVAGSVGRARRYEKYLDLTMGRLTSADSAAHAPIL